jgi:hypothetical protein
MLMHAHSASYGHKSQPRRSPKGVTGAREVAVEESNTRVLVRCRGGRLGGARTKAPSSPPPRSRGAPDAGCSGLSSSLRLQWAAVDSPPA